MINDGLSGKFFDVDAFYKTYYRNEMHRGGKGHNSEAQKKLHDLRKERQKKAKP